MRTLRLVCAAALLTALIAAAGARGRAARIAAGGEATDADLRVRQSRALRARRPPTPTGQADRAAAGQPKRDSILNGALIGAAIGGVGGSALIVASSGGSDDIARAMWNVSLLPTLAGAAAGAVIDALR